MTDPDHPVCLLCALGRCDDCTGRDGTRWCECWCPWVREEVERG